MFYITPEHHIEILPVKDYNNRMLSKGLYHMTFRASPHVPRQRGWVVYVANKNGVGTRQSFAYNKEEAIAFAEINYGIKR